MLAQDVVEPPVAYLGIALVVFLLGAGLGRHRGTGVGLQVAGMAAFTTVALVALALDPDLGRYVVAAGWIAHGTWDLIHLRRDRVVSRTYAEWCAVVDVVVGVGLLTAPLL
ncbi:hypothetical protein E1269_17130 [Jiangella asiatica]|uniref:Uncharacterized protein n=1 Tax=Jiangella asiatica TaxID=2530372 RepID=A0A4R5DD31_9ACTN|nr:hypothetical protein E1269_17130 [Jiangella asiatica]